MKKYGWYQDGECVQETSDDAYALINEAIAEFVAGEKLIAQNHGHSDDAVRENIADFVRKMRVGEMSALCASDLMDESDILEADEDFSGPLTRHDVCEMVNCRLAEKIDEGSACIKRNSKEFPTRVIGDSRAFAEAVMAWAKENISFDPPLICRGCNPIPICLVDGKWIWGDKKHEDADVQAYVVYTTVPCPETGHDGWGWWAQGRMGEAATLMDAMAQAEAKLAHIAAKEGAE